MEGFAVAEAAAAATMSAAAAKASTGRLDPCFVGVSYLQMPNSMNGIAVMFCLLFLLCRIRRSMLMKLRSFVSKTLLVLAFSQLKPIVFSTSEEAEPERGAKEQRGARRTSDAKRRTQQADEPEPEARELARTTRASEDDAATRGDGATCGGEG
jgi:hypothetical protein